MPARSVHGVEYDRADPPGDQGVPRFATPAPVSRPSEANQALSVTSTTWGPVRVLPG